MSHFIDLTGQRYDMLLVEYRVQNDSHGNAQYQCRCDCGNSVVVGANNLRNGNTHSCGCLKKQIMHDKQLKHGDAGGRHKSTERLYRIWRSMISRCYISSSTEYEIYGGRGIIVCDEWRNDYLCFKSWAIQNGYSDTLTLDRINNDGNYESSNCRWVTMKSQMNNKRNNHVITFNGKSQSLTEWANELGIDRSVLSTRLKNNWSIELALSTPPSIHNRLKTLLKEKSV